jgi:hypothetical protein
MNPVNVIWIRKSYKTSSLKMQCGIAVFFLGTFLTTISVYAQESKKHYLSPVLNLTGKGEYPVGNATVWTDEQGLQCSVVSYDEDPNRFDLKWERIGITLKDGTSIKAKSIESRAKDNFIQVVHDADRVIYWIPFEAIESITLKAAEPKSIQSVATVKEIYGRFSITYKKPYESSDLTQISSSSVNVSLRYPLKGGTRTISGFLFEGLVNLEYFDGTTWKMIAWKSVSKIEIKYGKNSVVPSTTPKFTYRVGSMKYSNVWNEYSLLVDKPNKPSVDK